MFKAKIIKGFFYHESVVVPHPVFPDDLTQEMRLMKFKKGQTIEFPTHVQYKIFRRNAINSGGLVELVGLPNFAGK